MSWEIAIRVLSVLGGLGFVGAIITALSLRSKVRAEAEKTGADAASVLTGSAMSLVEAVQADLKETQQELRALRRHLGVVEGLLRVNGIPVPEFAWPPS